MTLTRTQELVLACVPKATGALGFIGSALIIDEIRRTHVRKGNPMIRALFGMSVFYMFDAMAWFLSSWMAPTSTGFAFAIGNVSTCAFQGFWLQAVIAGPLYNAVMACYFFLISCHGCSVHRLVRLEYFMHAAVLFFALGTSIGFLVEDQYNHSKYFVVGGLGLDLYLRRSWSLFFFLAHTCPVYIRVQQSAPYAGSMEVPHNAVTAPL